MFSWLASAIISRQMARLRAGDYRPAARLDAPDIRFRFPGDSSWAAEINSRDEHERWLQRFVDVGLQLHADEVIAQGPPWNMTLCVRGTSHLDTDAGRVYANRYVMWGRIAWGRLRAYEVYEDTQAASKLDELLNAQVATTAPKRSAG